MARIRKVLAVTMLGASSSVTALDLSDTEFEKAAKKHGIDATLLYSVALAESARGRGEGTISPWPWALRSKTEGAHYAQSQAAAENKLDTLMSKYGSNIDVGVMQINLHWHGQKVESAKKLLDKSINIDLGAQILSETIKSAPNDYELGIGRYHIWTDEKLARNYASRVLAIYRNLKSVQGGQL